MPTRSPPPLPRDEAAQEGARSGRRLVRHLQPWAFDEGYLMEGQARPPAIDERVEQRLTRLERRVMVLQGLLALGSVLLLIMVFTR